MKNLELIAIIELSEDNKVICQSEGCGRAVFKRVHIVKIKGEIKILGSECFKKHYGILHSQGKLNPIYGSNNGIVLSEYERLLLLENTEKLLSEFNSRYIEAKNNLPDIKSKLSDAELWKQALTLTKEDFCNKRGINPELPGWKGWFDMEVKSCFEQLKMNNT